MPLSNSLGVNPTPTKVEANRYHELHKQQKQKINNVNSTTTGQVNSSQNKVNDFNTLLKKNLNTQSSQISGINKGKTPNLDKNGTNIASKELEQKKELAGQLAKWVLTALWQEMFNTVEIFKGSEDPGVKLYQEQLIQALVENNHEVTQVEQDILEEIKNK
ncbi:hypothetical protein [Candidatus Trichorickettsia mobilis]|uniref:hypothetical protein n=1 Tax=Candidatus Trichorickettsia mobilis TaxID=1346319 RepID=UPI00292D2FC8|nr:hypothetical protein [Candidatus Trichorickettsia mobilis]